MATQISVGRKAAYYLGAGLQIGGVLMFLSLFFSFATNSGSFGTFKANTLPAEYRAIGGMAMILVGKVLQTIGAKGIAGSGMILNPTKAREDLEPYSRMAGGMVKDAFQEADLGNGREPVQVVMVRCPSCKSLNQETAKFCQECGSKL